MPNFGKKVDLCEIAGLTLMKYGYFIIQVHVIYDMSLDSQLLTLSIDIMSNGIA